MTACLLGELCSVPELRQTAQELSELLEDVAISPTGVQWTIQLERPDVRAKGVHRKIAHDWLRRSIIF